MNQLDRALSVLEMLAARYEMSLADITTELDTSRPTAFRVLTALQARGYVTHVRERHVYRLGPAIRSLAARSDVPAIIQLAGPALSDLRAATGETVNLATVRRGRIVYAAIVDGSHALRMSASVGQELPPHATALGKAILSALPADGRDMLLGPEPYAVCTEKTLTRREGLDKELAIARLRGYAIDEEETDAGAVCVAAPIIGGDGVAVAALSVSSVAARFPREQWGAVGRNVKHWADRISSELGGHVVTDMTGEAKA